MSHGGSDGTLVDPEKPHEKPIVVDFGEEGSDPEDPFNWPRSKKISALGCAFFFSTLTAFNAAVSDFLREPVCAHPLAQGYSGCFATMLPDLQTSRLWANCIPSRAMIDSCGPQNSHLCQCRPSMDMCSRAIASSTECAASEKVSNYPADTISVSEQFGRRPMLLGSGICHTLCFLPQALAPNIWMIILFRSIQGIASSGANR
jgi:hypothetical protein